MIQKSYLDLQKIILRREYLGAYSQSDAKLIHFSSLLLFKPRFVIFVLPSSFNCVKSTQKEKSGERLNPLISCATSAHGAEELY